MAAANQNRGEHLLPTMEMYDEEPNVTNQKKSMSPRRTSQNPPFAF